MEEAGDGGAAGLRAFAVAAVALAGLAFSFTPGAERIDAWLLDREWDVLRMLAPRSAPDDIVIVGVDEASVRAIPQPIGAWNEPLGEVLVRIASANPRAIGIDIALPDRSLDALRPGLDRALLVGLAAARRNGPLVAALSIDAGTRAARPIYPPYLAVLGEGGLGIDLMPRDIDGVTRRYSLRIPTEDGSFPTLAGRLCATLSRRCRDGLIHFALGARWGYVAFHAVLGMRDAQRARELFHDRIVLIGDVRRYTNRLAVPFPLAAWEPPGGDAPGIVVHAQALRTALLDAAPAQASRPLAVLLVAVCALVVLARDWRLAAAGAALGSAALATLAVVSLQGGTFVPVSAAMGTLLAAALAHAASRAWKRYGKRFTK